MAIWGSRVVLVDDDPPSLRLIAGILEGEGAQVIVVDAPGQALVTIAGVMPDVVIMGLEMGGLDALGLVGKIRTLSPEKGGRIPAAALSASRLGTDSLAVLRIAGFQTHLDRGALATELRTAIAILAGEAVERRHAARDPEQWPANVRRERRLEVR